MVKANKLNPDQTVLDWAHICLQYKQINDILLCLLHLFKCTQEYFYDGSKLVEP